MVHVTLLSSFADLLESLLSLVSLYCSWAFNHLKFFSEEALNIAGSAPMTTSRYNKILTGRLVSAYQHGMNNTIISTMGS